VFGKKERKQRLFPRIDQEWKPKSTFFVLHLPPNHKVTSSIHSHNFFSISFFTSISPLHLNLIRVLNWIFFSSSFFLLHDPSSPRQLHRHTLCGRLLGRSSIDLGVIHNEFSQFKQQLVRPLYSLSFSFFIFYFLFFIFHFFHFFIFFSFLFSFFSQTSAAKLKAALTGQACTIGELETGLEAVSTSLRMPRRAT